MPALASTLVASKYNPRPPDQPSGLAEIDDTLEEALKDLDAEPLPDAGQTGVVGEFFVERVAQVPAVRKVETGRFDELPLGADALEKHDELELEEDDRIDTQPAAVDIELQCPLAHEP
jgi:hypothetical protein